MKIKLKKIFLSSIAILSPLLISPYVVSCSYNISGDLSLPEQQELINSPNAKKAIFNNWLTSTYASLYMKHILKSDDQSKGQAIVNFLTYLDGKNSDKNNNLEPNELNELAKTVYSAYKFYVTYYSSISSSSSSSISSTAATYFLEKSLEWQKNKLSTTNGENLKELTNKINVGVLNTQDDLANWKQDEVFKLMFTAHGTEIYENVLKILIAEMYFLNVSEDEIKAGSDYNKQTKNIRSQEYLNASSYDVNSKNYFLHKYLVEKNPQFKWSFNSENASFINNITDIVSFNNLMGWTKDKMNKIITPYSFDNFSGVNDYQSLSKIKGFSNLEFNTTITDGDLTNNWNTISTFGTYKSGVYNNQNKLLYSFNNLKARNKIAEKPNSYYLPLITLDKNKISSKTVQQISTEDFIIEGRPGSKNPSKLVLEDSSENQKWEITNISFLPQNTKKVENQKINISVRYTFNNQYEYNYDFDITWNKTGVIENLFDKIFSFDSAIQSPSQNTNAEKINSLFPESINSLVDGKLNISYVMRPLPIFKWDWNSNSINAITIKDETYMQGKWSLDQTAWSKYEARRNLVYWFVIKDEDKKLWNSIQDFYLFNNYNIESSDLIVKSQINSLGLTKKTDKDRREAGIIY